LIIVFFNAKYIHRKISENNNLPTQQIIGKSILIARLRNSKCPCGSGKRYKHCCGKIVDDQHFLEKESFTYIFHHIPKCGGTSMRDVFEVWFNRCIEDYRPAWATDKRLEKFKKNPINLEKVGRNAIVCGHYEVDGIRLHQRYPQIFTQSHYRLITFVRDPLKLKLSLYKYEKKHNRIKSKKDISQHLLKHSNVICYILGCNENNMDEILSRYFFIGITDKSQDSLDELAYLLGKPPIKLPKLHVIDEKIKLSDEFVAEFKERNTLDYTLYEKCLNIYESIKAKNIQARQK